MVEVRYRYRLRVSNSQAGLLQAVFDACRFVWNQALGRWGDLWRQEQIALSYGAANKELTDWRSRFEWLAEQPSIPQQQVLRDLYRAIGAFEDVPSSVELRWRPWMIIRPLPPPCDPRTGR
jgi:putative transposase